MWFCIEPNRAFLLLRCQAWNNQRTVFGPLSLLKNPCFLRMMWHPDVMRNWTVLGVMERRHISIHCVGTVAHTSIKSNGFESLDAARCEAVHPVFNGKGLWASREAESLWTWTWNLLHLHSKNGKLFHLLESALFRSIISIFFFNVVSVSVLPALKLC